VKCIFCPNEVAYIQVAPDGIQRVNLCKTHAEAIEEQAPIGSIRALSSESLKVKL
jgi:hypothetical protein